MKIPSSVFRVSARCGPTPFRNSMLESRFGMEGFEGFDVPAGSAAVDRMNVFSYAKVKRCFMTFK